MVGVAFSVLGEHFIYFLDFLSHAVWLSSKKKRYDDSPYYPLVASDWQKGWYVCFCIMRMGCDDRLATALH
jgi:hypothetical protein